MVAIAQLMQAIALLCQLQGSSSTITVEQGQRQCHAYYAACILADDTRFGILTCMQKRNNR